MRYEESLRGGARIRVIVPYHKVFLLCMSVEGGLWLMDWVRGGFVYLWSKRCQCVLWVLDQQVNPLAFCPYPGYYTALSLLQSNKKVRVDIVEALPTPFGLVRSGVAPDHQDVR